MARVRERWTRSGVRLREAAVRPGRWNWLFVPGGPGLGSESLADLVRAVDVPGRSWLVDLPGDGSNRALPGVPPDPYRRWPHVLAEAAEKLDHVVLAGHSTGAMFILSVPALAERAAGLALISGAPHSGWRDAFAAYAAGHPLPAVEAAAAQYDRTPDDRTLRALTLAAAPWNFGAGALPAGRELLQGLPYCHAAVAWADAGFDAGYRARWVPSTIPALIVSGEHDHVVDQRLWDAEPGFARPPVTRHVIPGAGHWPWLDDPAAVRTAFAELTDRLA
ncbi:alpha/beta fold hydrolase [Streptantibioticus silvisoli]|uniref:Alpha/beta hydrolase n=1 Tax=Streptantibioticus silvisoli TaxID=2705255 RepID=A0ABT6VYZ3_9ACTN|nr:alpha/beta hydrolase [Streptantibioticus silvisoli]MDI5962496.1 alpha/beta hydrolase [Streptantibioticus silvisoli]